MPSYKIYLTKSSEVASRLVKTFDISTGDIASVGSGKVNEGNEHVPAVYHEKGFFYCKVELKPNGEHDTPTYELTIC